MAEELTSIEKIALAAFYWRHDGYPTEGHSWEMMKQAVDAHFSKVFK